ncbi:hypothetical protein GIB67_040303 [Kingdonia uniflora]|uniref:Uncharacterized protein n=1 Tax=Kingdonia uniflora TaxID=39325 RepID=A0A7J7MV28_9MAGN|nr:hypothetical protein GIB67_040303 [Kingdonia uniflora]
MVLTFGCAKADEVDLVGHLSPVIGVGDEEDTVSELVEWPRLKGSRVEYPTSSSRFREFCVSKGGDYLYLLPDLVKEKKCRHLGDEVSLEYVQGVVKDSRTDGFCCYLAQFDYWLTLPLSNLAKGVMNMIGACPAQLNCNFWEVILVCETLNEKWAASGSEMRITVKDFLEYYAVKYITTTDGAYLSSNSSRPCFFNLSSAGRVWNDNLLWVSGKCLQWSDEEPLELNNRTIIKGISCKVSRKESFIDTVAKEGTELEAVLKELEISRFKRVVSKDEKVRRSQAKRRMAGETPGFMEDELLTPDLNTPLKLAWLNEMPDGPVDLATVSSTVVRNLAKRKAVKRGAFSRSVTSDSVDDSCKRRKVTSPTRSQVVLEESDKIAEGADLRSRFEVEAGLLEEQCRAKAREKMIAVVDDEFKKLEGEKNQFEEKLTRKREVFLLELEKEREAVALKLKEVRAESVAKAERLVTASATSRNNLVGKLYQLGYTKVEILAFNEGNYEEKKIVDEEEVEEIEDGLNVAEKTSAYNQESIDQKELDVTREREKQTLLYNAEYADEYEALISLYEDRLDDNVKLSLKLEDAKRQVEDKTATILSRDLALNQLTSELAELKGKAASGSRHEAELAEYRIRALNDEIADMKCNREAQGRADLAEVRANNKSLVDELTHARGNVRKVVQRDKEMNERINQLYGRISELEWELRSINLTRQMSERIDQLTAELAESKARRLKDNKRAAVTHQSFKELVVHEQEKCDGKALHQRQLSALVAFLVEEIKFLQVERDLMQDCISGRTCVCKLDISSIDPIGVMDLGIGTTMAE